MNDSTSPLTISLPGGNRRIAYAQYGDPRGRPVFHFHGGNSSRLEGAWFDAAAAAKGVRLIAPDRPGVGLSSPQPDRRLLDWAGDVAALADALHIERFAVMGLSGGGPHVAAAAYALPDRLQAAAIISGTGPPQMPGRFRGMFPLLRLNFTFARYAPWLNKIFLSQMAGSYDDPDKFLQMVERGMPQPDRDLAAQRPELIRQFSAAAVESHRQGLEADQQEWGLYVRPWGFDLAQIRVPVHLWYGVVDNFVPVGMGRYLAAQIPGSELHIVPDGGHFSTINNYIGDILDGLAQHQRRL